MLSGAHGQVAAGGMVSARLRPRLLALQASGLRRRDLCITLSNTRQPAPPAPAH